MSPLPDTMCAMVTMGHGDIDQIVRHDDWPRPDPAAGEVLIRVGACGLNNTDVNTRSGWDSKSVSQGTTGGALRRSAARTRPGAVRRSPFRVFRAPMCAAGL